MQATDLPAIQPGCFSLPVWATASQVKNLYNLSESALERLGIASIKLGTTQQSRRLFRVSDIDEKLADLATRQPAGGER